MSEEREKYIKGELAKKIKDFEKAHPEMDAGWLADLIAEVYEYAEKRNSTRRRS